MAFIKNPNYNPNDPTSQRFISQEEVAVDQGFSLDLAPINTSIGGSTPSIIPSQVQGARDSVSIVNPNAGQPANTTPIQIGPSPNVLNTGVAPAPTPTPSPAPVATPQKKIYRVGQDIYDAETNKLLTPTEFAQSYSGRAVEVNAPRPQELGGISPDDQIKVDNILGGGGVAGVDTGVSDVDSLSELVKLAKQGGLSLEDTMSLINAQTGVTSAEKDAIRNELGIPDLISETFEAPTSNTQEIYNRAYRESGLASIKKSVADIDDQINTIREQSSQAVTDERKNPFISQASRSGRLRIIQQDAEQKIANLNNQRTQLINTYDRGIDEIEGVISRYTGQLEEGRALNVQKLNFLLTEAERQVGELEGERATEALRFVPEFLQAETTVDPFSKESLDIQLKLLAIEKAQKELDAEEDPIERRKKELELEKLEAEVAKSRGGAVDNTQVELLQDKVNQIDELINSDGLNSVVGTTALGRIPLLDKLTGEAQNFSAGVKQLISKETIDTLVNLKERGGTLGALSDQERIMLQNAASKIGTWEIKKDGFGTGRFNASEKDFVEELENIKMLANRAIEKAGGVAGGGNIQADYESLDFDIPYSEAVQTYGESGLQQIIDSQKKNGNVSVGTGMRTDRHNNPTAFTTDIAKQAGLVEGVDYQVGDPFPNNPNQKTALLIGDPVEQTIKVIDNIGFYTQGGNQRWTHTAMSKSQWDALSDSAKGQVIREMYKREGNQGQLNKYFA